MQKRLPIGIENFEDMINEDYYYIDKTGLIKQLIAEKGLVNLFTRPRRFGKSLNMSMLRYFFEIGNDPKIFEGLEISKEKELCDQYMGKFPVISISLKGAKAGDYQTAKHMMKYIVGGEARRIYQRMSEDQLNETHKEEMKRLMEYEMEDTTLMAALWNLSLILKEYYGKKVIILIDEYDVPLDKAFENGYYNEMIILIRNMLEQALKTNDNLYMAVLTGCLRIARESIFTGLNNFNIFSITDQYFDEYFGFTDKEVKEMLKYYGAPEAFDETKKWYDGYRFGNEDIYCPWDVINHVDCLRGNPDAEPLSYWINTSGNELVRRFIDRADKTTRDEIERLIAGESIEKTVRMELTYDEIDNSLDNLWSVLFTTGYLTQAGKTERGVYRLTIPNREIREVYVLQIKEWFERAVLKEAEPTKNLLKAIKEGNAGEIEERLTKILGNTISIFDTKGRNEEKEIFYHGLLLGLLRSDPNWLVQSNAESGDGFADILAEPEDPDAGIVIELKYSQTFSGLQNACERALAQIREKRYDERLRNEGRNNILAYGVAFCKKRCKVAVQRL